MLLIVKMVDISVDILKVINITVNVTSTHVEVFCHLVNSLNLKTAIRVMFVGQTTVCLWNNLQMISGWDQAGLGTYGTLFEIQIQP